MAKSIRARFREQISTTVTKTYEPIKQPFIVLAFCLFLLEIALRKFALLSLTENFPRFRRNSLVSQRRGFCLTEPAKRSN